MTGPVAPNTNTNPEDRPMTKTTAAAKTLDQVAKDAALALAKAIAACVAYEIASTTDGPYDLVLAQTLAEAPEMAELTLEAGYAFYEDSQAWGEEDE